MRSSTRQKIRSVGRQFELDPRQVEALAAASEEAKVFAAALLSVTEDQAPPGVDPGPWAKGKHREGARIGAVLVSGSLEPGFPNGSAEDGFIWSSNGAHVPPYQPSEEEIDWFTESWTSVLGEYIVDPVVAALKVAAAAVPPVLNPLAKYTKWLPTALGALGTAFLRTSFPILPQVVSLAPLAIGVGVQVVNAVEEAKVKVTP